MRRSKLVWLAVGLGLLLAPAAGFADPGHITGVGGVFFKSKDPKALAAWYRDVLGLDIAPWGGAMLRYDAPGHPPMVVWSPFAPNSEEMAGSTRFHDRLRRRRHGRLPRQAESQGRPRP
jgi:hypothetical protein